MTKFLGVISNSAKSCSDQHVFEFSDLELLSDCLYDETQNLYYDFLEKLKFINDRELIILENSKNLAQIHEYLLTISLNMLMIEGEINEMGNCLTQLDAVLFHMQQNSENLSGKCTSNMDRDRILGILVQLSVDVHRMEHQIEETKEQECVLSEYNLHSWTLRFVPFLDLHNKFLLHTENKIWRMNDLIKEVDEIFFRLHKRLMCAQIHRAHHPFVTDC